MAEFVFLTATIFERAITQKIRYVHTGDVHAFFSAMMETSESRKESIIQGMRCRDSSWLASARDDKNA